jgi:DNA polymerase-3 subunit gamma/tau
VKAAPGIDPETLPTESELCAARILAEGLDIAYLTRLWQVLLKGLGEIKIAPDSFAAAEMILVRIAYMSDLPTPEKIIKDLSNPRENSVQNAINSNENAEHHHQQVTKSTRQSSLVQTNYVSGTNLAHIVQQEQAHNAQTIIRPQNFIEMVDLFKKHGEILLYNWLFANVRLVKFEQGRLEISVCESLPADFSARIADCLKNWTGERWVIVISKQQGQPTIYEGEHASELKLKEDLKTDPEISKVLQMFPGAVIEKIGG